MLRKKTGIDLGRSISRASGRVANTFKRPNGSGMRSASVMAAAAGIAGAYAAVRFLRRGNGAGPAFDIYPNEDGGWTVKASEAFETRSQALDVARRATAALRSDPVAGNPLGAPDSAVRRPWSNQISSPPSTESARRF